MLAYIVRRLLLIIPTLFGILLINFIIIQAAPGGPVEQMIAKLEGFEGATSRIAGGGAEVSVAGSSSYRGAQGLDPALIKEIEKMYGFDKSAPERLWIMVKNYARLDFGDSFFRDAKVIDLIKEKMPVSISLGLWSTLIMYLVSTPGDRQGHATRQPLRCVDQLGNHRRLCDPGLPVCDPADRGVCRRQLFRLVPLARADVQQLR